MKELRPVGTQFEEVWTSFQYDSYGNKENEKTYTTTYEVIAHATNVFGIMSEVIKRIEELFHYA